MSHLGYAQQAMKCSLRIKSGLFCTAHAISVKDRLRIVLRKIDVRFRSALPLKTEIGPREKDIPLGPQAGIVNPKRHLPFVPDTKHSPARPQYSLSGR